MTKYIPRKKTTYPFKVTTLNGESISFDNNLTDAKKEGGKHGILFTIEMGRTKI